MKILVTGINGFVGKHLRKKLIERNHDVFGIDLKGNDKNIFFVDIRNLDEVKKCILNIEPEIIVHLAAISKVDYRDPTQLYNINTTGTINILTSAIQLDTIPKFLLISSSQVYGSYSRNKKLITEDCPIKPINSYGASKASCEIIAGSYNIEYKLPLQIVRTFNHIGRGQDPHFVIPKIIKSVKDKQESIELGNINAVRDFLDVRDVVSAYILLIENFQNGEIYNVASGKGYSISEILDILERITGKKLIVNVDSEFIRNVDIDVVLGDASKIMSHMNWSPEFEIEETLKWMLLE
jgi:nucleoside-diphosphate-sugar epimerase